MSDGSVWDAICIGAGITSLAFGALMARKNPHVKILVLDKHIVPGGYATNFRRKRETKAIFDCSLHKISGSHKPQGNFLRVFNSLELQNDIELVEHPHSFEACTPGFNLAMPNDPVQVESILINKFPEDAEGIRQFFHDLRVHGHDAYHHYQIMDGSYDVDMKNLRYAHKNYKNVSVKDVLKQRIKSLYLIEILSAPSVYVGGYADDMSYLYFLHVVFATLYMGNTYVKGSSQKLSNTLVERIEEAGGKVKLKTNVTNITPVDGGDSFEINTSRGVFYTKNLYINSSPRHAIIDLFQDQNELEEVKARVLGLKPARSTTTLYITTDIRPKDLGFTSSETMIFGEHVDLWESKRNNADASSGDEALCEDAYWKNSPMEVTEYYSLNPEGGYVLCMNVLDQISHWPERGTKPYKAKKERAKAELLERLYKAKPGLRGHVLFSELATPRTYFRFTNNDLGSGFGTMTSPDPSSNNFGRSFPYKNVTFLSSWVAGPGYEAAFVYAERMANRWDESCPPQVTNLNL